MYYVTVHKGYLNRLINLNAHILCRMEECEGISVKIEGKVLTDLDLCVGGIGYIHKELDGRTCRSFIKNIGEGNGFIVVVYVVTVGYLVCNISRLCNLAIYGKVVGS